MDALSIVPKQPVGQLSIESRNINSQQSPMVIGELFLNGAIESFAVAVLFGCAGTSMIVRQVQAI